MPLFLLVLLGCRNDEPTPEHDTITDPDAPIAWPSLDGGNLVIIQVDTLRADRLGIGGHHRQTTPRLAERSWLSLGPLISASSWTVPSTASVLTGLHPYEHKVVHLLRDKHDQPYPNLDLANTTLLEHLAGQGYRTAFMTGNPLLDGYGYDRGAEVSLLRYEDLSSSNTGKFLGDIEGWLEQVDDDAFALFFQPFDPHQSYSPEPTDLGTWAQLSHLGDYDPATQVAEGAALAEGWQQSDDQQAFTRAVEALYDEQLLGMDRSIDALLDLLEDRGVLDDTLVVLTADHGETLGELDDGWFGHGRDLRRETLHVPLHLMVGDQLSQVAPCMASSIDLAPTVLEILDQPPMMDISGRALQEGCRDQAIASFHSTPAPAIVTALDAEAQLVWHCWEGQRWAYDLAADPKASTVLDPEDVAADHLAATLRERIAAMAEHTDVLHCGDM